MGTIMGIWEQLRSIAAKVTNRNAPEISSDSKASGGIPDVVTKIGDALRCNGAQKLEDYVPDPHRREKISTILTNLGRFAVDSAVNESLKGVTGGIQVYKIVQEGLKDQPPPSHPANGNKKPDLTLTMEQMQAQLAKMQEEMNNIKQQNEISTHCAEASDPLKELSTEPTGGSSAPRKTDVKKVMIRSRL